MTGGTFNGGPEVESKWGDFPLYRHQLLVDRYNEQPQNVKYFRRSVDVPEDCWSIEDALDKAAPGQTIEVKESGQYSSWEMMLFDNITINDKITIKLLPGQKMIDFNNKSITIAEGGTFDIPSDVTVYLKDGNNSNIFWGLFTSIQNAIDNALDGQKIELHGTFNESFTLTGKTGITIVGNGATINGSITINNSSNCIITGLHLSNGNQIYINGGIGNYVDGYLCDNSTGALSLYNTTTCLVTNLIATNGDPGEFACNISGSTGNIYNSSTIEGYACGVFVGYNSGFNITDNYFCNNGYDVDAELGGFAYLENNTYSRISPVSILGNYYIADNPSIACDNSMMAKAISGSLKQQSSAQMAGLDNDLHRTYLDLIRKISKDELKDYKELKNKYKSDYDKIIIQLKKTMNKENTLSKLKSTLSLLSHCYKWLGEKEAFYALINELLYNSDFNYFAPYIRRYTIDRLIDEKNYKGAAEVADSILKTDNIDQDLTSEMLYEKGLICKFYLQDNSQAYSSFSMIMEQYPKLALSKMARGQLNDLSKDSRKPYLKSIDNTASELKCSNYPNPFNPMTRFNFSIPSDGYTELKIYNSLGQEVTTLVSDNLTKGKYCFEWNASSYSSGMYFYNLRCGNMFFTSKLILIK